MVTSSNLKCCKECQAELSFAPGSQPARAEECPNCQADLHSCIQCEFYDTNAYNECKEPQAERVVDKKRANFCDYFRLATSANCAGGGSNREDALKKLDDIFK